MATLGFSTKWPKHMGGGDTDFIPKIWYELHQRNIIDGITIQDYVMSMAAKGLFSIIPNHINFTPKIHTIRHDSKNLWKPGRKIHPVVFNRTKNRFQFAPVLECKSVQKIVISHKAEKFEDWILKPVVRIDNKILLPESARKLAVNDGFNGLSDFFQWFNEDFEGKIIHWTKLKY